MHLLNAYVDESVHDDHGLYVIAAVLADPALAPTAASALRAVVPGGEAPHWHVENQPVRAALVAAVVSLDVEARIYGCRYETSRRAEAARARALGWFLADVDPTSLGEIVLDRRQSSQNRRDQLFLDSVLPRRRRVTYRHAASASEPLLWAADIVVGAACATWFRGADHLRALDPVLDHCAREPG